MIVRSCHVVLAAAVLATTTLVLVVDKEDNNHDDFECCLRIGPSHVNAQENYGFDNGTRHFVILIVRSCHVVLAAAVLATTTLVLVVDQEDNNHDDFECCLRIGPSHVNAQENYGFE